MKVTFVAGSHRENSQTAKVAKFLQKRIEEIGRGMGLNKVETQLLDLGENALPMWSPKDSKVSLTNGETLDSLKQSLRSSDGFVILTPEWHGMATPAIKNFFLYFSSGELAHKPALLVGVSSGRGGSYPIAELRQSSYKNSRICYIPDHLIVRDANNVLNSSEASGESDEFYHTRANFSLKQLLGYATGLKTARDAFKDELANFPNGM
jgi:NAD(P)H-dependent FMN reductase